MDRNVGKMDRTARIATGSALIGAGLATGPLAPIRSKAAVGMGGMMVATGATGRCPAYEATGVDTTEG